MSIAEFGRRRYAIVGRRRHAARLTRPKLLTSPHAFRAQRRLVPAQRDEGLHEGQKSPPGEMYGDSLGYSRDVIYAAFFSEAGSQRLLNVA